MADNRKYYYLKLKENFFDSDSIVLLEDMKDGILCLSLLLFTLLLNVRTRPDFIAYRFEDRSNLSLRLCRGFYKVQEASWTVRDRETMEKADAQNPLPA